MNGRLSTELWRLVLPVLWFGMVAAIGFIEAPLKFQAPGITIPLGLGIGRLVFAALNAVEGLLLVALILVSLWPRAARLARARLAWLAGLAALFVVKIALVRPAQRPHRPGARRRRSRPVALALCLHRVRPSDARAARRAGDAGGPLDPPPRERRILNHDAGGAKDQAPRPPSA
ncbi:hypothetical protein [Leucobacter soli]|uniref:hypothetical protein n=1 Tax=Leucobacter soli TaxID=2812850 RepID=UPI00360D0662